MANISQLFDAYAIPSDTGVNGLDLFQRFDVLERLGMLADEGHIGHPERPYSEWSSNEIALALEIFKTWPEFEDANQKYDEVGKLFAKQFVPPASGDRHDLLVEATKALTEAAKQIYGRDFPDVEVIFVELKSDKNHFYAGLNVEDEVEVNTNRLNDASVNGSEFDGNASYVELLLHEVTHLIQRHAARKSDGKTHDGDLSALVAESFYEATYGLPKSLKALYWNHPWETEARKQAARMMRDVLAASPELGFDSARPVSTLDMSGNE